MGIVTMGVPEEITLELARLAGATVFVETGTYHGGTPRWAARHFRKVYTIEKAESLYRQHHAELRQLGNVEPLLGDSRDRLPKIVAELAGERAIYWLDGHWSGGETAGADDPCPLLDELKILADRGQDVILIDDARLFLSQHYKPFVPGQWPTIAEVARVLGGNGPPRFIQIIHDIIFAVPAAGPAKDRLVAYSQEQSPPFWNSIAEYLKDRRRGVVRRLLKNARRLFQGTNMA